MKNIRNIFAIVSVLLISIVTYKTLANTKGDETSTFKVYGNCEMCKKRIETALLKNKNIKKANWDVTSKMLTVIYNSNLISLEVIHKIISEAGHDTEKVKASDSSYKNLPGCCHYERKK
ncbi:MAG TPA: heavy-metal-associated domain-containing protein [Cytophagaceae bacterium]|jgi:mercuric ion binding protein|nr:heavy-metal-associated domain-containing protein [Cytophagaceae bacterium]